MILGLDEIAQVKPRAAGEEGATDTGSPLLGLTVRTRRMSRARGA